MAGIDVAKLIARIVADSSGLESGLKDADAKLKRAGQRIEGVGRTLSLGVTAPLVAMGAMAVKTASDFEQTFNVLQAQTGATGEDLKRMSKLARDLGADLTLPGTSAKDAAEAMLEMSKAGMSVADTMDAAKGVLQLSAAAQVSNARAAEITANALNAFSLSGTEAGRVADLLAATAKSASGNVDDMAQALQMSAAVFAQAQVPVEDLMTAIAMMAKAGIQGSDAGTSLKVMLMRLMAPTDQARMAIEQLGVRIYDARGQMVPFRDIIAQFNTALSKMTQEQRAAALSTIFGTDAIRAANIVLGEGTGAWDKLRAKVMEAGAAGKLSKAQMEGLKGAMDGFQSAVDTIATSEGFMALLRGLAWLIRQVTEAINVLALMPVPLQYAAIGLVAVTAALGPLLLVLGRLIAMLPALRAAAATIGALGVGAGTKALLLGTALPGAAAAAGAGAAAAAPAAAAGVGAAGAAAGVGAAAGLGARGLLGRAGAGAARGVGFAAKRALGPVGLAYAAYELAGMGARYLDARGKADIARLKKEIAAIPSAPRAAAPAMAGMAGMMPAATGGMDMGYLGAIRAQEQAQARQMQTFATDMIGQARGMLRQAQAPAARAAAIAPAASLQAQYAQLQQMRTGTQAQERQREQQMKRVREAMAPGAEPEPTEQKTAEGAQIVINLHQITLEAWVRIYHEFVRRANPRPSY